MQTHSLYFLCIFDRYFLGDEAASGGAGFSLFGGAKSPASSVQSVPVKQSGPDKAALQAEARKKAQEEAAAKRAEHEEARKRA